MEGEGMSVNRLAQLAGIPQPTLFKYLKGGGTPTVDTFDSLAAPLTTDLEELLAAARRRV
nr:helix-turn-helix transcriptional regulator [Enterococcus hirae]